MISAVAFHCGKAENNVKEILESGRQKLLDVREKRIPPSLDDKSLTSWNALMITAFAKGYKISNEVSFLEAAKNGINFIEKNLIKDDKLLHTYKNGSSKINGYLDDHAYFVNALLDVFEINPDLDYLETAILFGNYLIDHFWDKEHNNFFMTSDDHEALIIRPKSNYDLSLPSGNSVTASAFLRLYHLTHEQKFLDISTKIMESQATMAAENPFGFGNLLNTIYWYLNKPLEITIINSINSEISENLSKRFLPESILVNIQNENQINALSKYPFFAGKNFTSEKTTIFVCRDFTCSLPLENFSDVEKYL